MLKTIVPSKDLEAQLKDFHVVDVREPGERVSNIGYMPTSVSLPLAQILEGGASPNVGKHTPLLMVCRSGRRSERAGIALVERGFTNVTNLDGGTLAWLEAELATVLLSERTPDAVTPTVEQTRDALVACFIDAGQQRAAMAGETQSNDAMLVTFLRGVFAGARVDFEAPSKRGLTDVVAALAAHVKSTHDLESIARNSAEIMSLVEAIDE
jgi:rhodanese-related sulfurtransferase